MNVDSPLCKCGHPSDKHGYWRDCFARVANESVEWVYCECDGFRSPDPSVLGKDIK